VIANQQENPKWYGVIAAKLVLQRTDAGQSREDAIEAVLATTRQRIMDRLALLDSEAAAKAAFPAEPVAPIAPVAHKAPKATNGKTAKSKASV
jgi:hypothetical protein